MKKFLLLCLVFVLTMNVSAVFAQYDGAPQAQNNRADIYYGFPNLYGLILESIVRDLTNTFTSDAEFSVRFTNHFGFKYERRLTPAFGFGAEVYYSESELRARDNLTATNVDLKLTRLRTMLRFNFIYNAKTVTNTELFGAVAAGYKFQNIELTSNDPNIEPESIEAAIPVTVRFVPLGVRHFFSPNIGFQSELGFGGALINVGLSARF